MFTVRFDMRAPSTGAPTTDLYPAVIDMCAWVESRGAIVAVLSEHHGADDNHLPSPIVLASAIAARTERLAIMLAAVVLPFWDPVRLAEDMAVLDIISNGRVSYAFGIGHRPEEYEHFGVDFSRRGRLADEKLDLLRRLLAGEPVVFDGRRIHITPACVSPGGPFIMVAGGSEAAVKRAARHGLGVVLQTNQGGLKELYENECRAQRPRAWLRSVTRRQRSDRRFRRRRRRRGVGRAGPAPAARCGDRGRLSPRRRWRRQHFPRHRCDRATRSRRPVPDLHHRTKLSTTCAAGRRCRSHRCAVGCRRSWRGRIWNAPPRRQLEHADEGEP